MIKMSSIDVKNKIRLNIKEFEEVIVINDDTSATTLVQELRQMASFGPESKFHPNFDQKPLKCIWVKSLVLKIHYFWDKWLMPFLKLKKTSVWLLNHHQVDFLHFLQFLFCLFSKEID